MTSSPRVSAFKGFNRPLTPPGVIPPDRGREKALKYTRLLIWAYMALLILEGALRKWILPQLSDPLLIIRDPVVLLIYLCALRAGVFPRHPFVITLGIIAFLSALVGMLVLLPYLSFKTNFLVTAYGFRSNFLHLPLIFVIANVFDARDVKRMGKWILIALIPMALLMAAQFQASPDSAINRTAGIGEGEQITAGGGKIRPPGTFSFVSGIICFVGVAAAFLIHGILSRTTYRNWLLFAAGFALVVCIVVSGSRSVVATVGLVLLSLVVILVVRPEAVNQIGKSLLLVAVLGWAMSYLPIFQQGLGILSNRFVESAEATDTTIAGGMISRVFAGFIEGFRVFDRLPFFGHGLGLGTNAGAKFVTGHVGFLLGEGEWSRLLLEGGPILGLSFIIWRVALTVYLGLRSVRALGLGETLPIILFSSMFVTFLNGQFGQPTILGFAALFAGLCLAATTPETEPVPLEAPELPPARPAVPKSSPHAARLRRTSEDRAKSNGSPDR